MTTQLRSWTHWLVKLQGFFIVLMLFGVAATRFELLPFRAAFGSFGLALLAMALIGFIAALVLIWGWIKPAAQHRFHAGLAAVVGFLPLLFVVVMVGPGKLSAPPIHDISTDTDNPPEFVAARRERTAEQNTLDYSGAGVASVQQRAYPDIKPLLTHRSYVDAYKHCLATVEKFGWRVLAEDLETGVIEATDETAVFGFKDDVVIRVTVDGDGSRIDMRSVSRVGVSDLGANAGRIRRFQAAYKDL